MTAQEVEATKAHFDKVAREIRTELRAELGAEFRADLAGYLVEMSLGRLDFLSRHGAFLGGNGGSRSISPGALR